MEIKKALVHSSNEPALLIDRGLFVGKCRYVLVRIRKKDLLSFDNKSFSVIRPYGGDKRDRTADLLNAIQALSQLSYTPVYSSEEDRV